MKCNKRHLDAYQHFPVVEILHIELSCVDGFSFSLQRSNWTDLGHDSATVGRHVKQLRNRAPGLRDIRLALGNLISHRQSEIQKERENFVSDREIKLLNHQEKDNFDVHISFRSRERNTHIPSFLLR